MKRITMAVLLGLLALGACSDDDDDGNGVDPKPFSLDIEVVDDAGAPVEGLQVQLHAPIEGFVQKRATSRKAASVIPYTLATQAAVTLTVGFLGGDQIDVLLEDVVREAGAHRQDWDGRDGEGEPIVGTVPLVFFLRAQSTDDGTVLFEGESNAVLYTSPDLAQQPLLGVTDADGRMSTTVRDYFPTLLDLPELLSANENGVIGDPIVFNSTVEIVLREAGTANVQYELLNLADGPNTMALVWTDPTPKYELAAKPTTGSGLKADAPVVGIEFSIGPVFPSPFN